MQTISVTVDPRHFGKLAANPARALTELIWNSLDADAHKIDIVFDRNALGGVEALRVIDDGHGMTEDAAIEDFSRLGSSWKQHAERSKAEGRLLHGRDGQGRWAAYGLGEQIAWTSVAEVDGTLSRIEIVGRRSRPNEFEIDSAPAPANATVGTTVEVKSVADGVAALAEEKARERLATAELALYLSMYPVDLALDGTRLDLAEMQERRHDEDLALPDGLGDAKLTIIEWIKPVERAMYLCDEDGFTLSETPARFHAPGFNFTLYVRWAGFRERIADLSVAEFDADLTAVIDTARAAARIYFNERTREHERETIERWKEEGVYPYEAEPEPEAEVERAERALFDIVATTAAPTIDTADMRAKKLSLRLLRNAVADPSSLRRIIEDILDLPELKRAELVDLLERTTLGDMIAATKQVTNRLDWLHGLEALVFEPELRGVVKERTQLHRMVASETWIFGEEYALTADDESLTTVLKRHVKLLGRDDLAPEPVLRTDGSTGIVDLMLSRAVERRDKQREHLVLELKAPRVNVGTKEIGQIKSYAHAVAEDARFASTNTRWEFWVISTDVTTDGDRERKQRGRPFGLAYEPDDAPIQVWIKTWSEVIEDAAHRMKFFQHALNVQATRDQGVEYLRKRHAEFLPDQLQNGTGENEIGAV
ncbi:MAG: ATP-binding protein [Gaiella sp.]|nr:ATP-binding protein [Gaiella sp.]